MPVKFNRTFTGREKNTKLADTIIENELTGVTAWALEGAVRALRSDGYTIPMSTLAAREEWKRRANQVRQFVDERIKPSSSFETGGQHLYDEYKRWAQANGHRPLANNNFAERMEDLGFGKDRDSSGNYWNVQINDTVSP
jgi:putative DNA primase/helicase